jgi:hypothetical protein
VCRRFWCGTFLMVSSVSSMLTSSYPVQAWTYSGGTYSITFALPNSQHPTTQTLCLDVTNGSTANGNKLQMYTCSAGNANQQFTYTSDNRIARTNQHECVDLTGGNTAVGTQVRLIMMRCCNPISIICFRRFKCGIVHPVIITRFVLPRLLSCVSTNSCCVCQVWNAGTLLP